MAEQDQADDELVERVASAMVGGAKLFPQVNAAQLTRDVGLAEARAAISVVRQWDALGGIQ